MGSASTVSPTPIGRLMTAEMRMASAEVLGVQRRSRPCAIAPDIAGTMAISERRDERRREVEERLRLAVHAVEDLRLIVAEARGGLETVHAQLESMLLRMAMMHAPKAMGMPMDRMSLLSSTQNRRPHRRQVCRSGHGFRRNRGGEPVVVAALVYYHIQQRNDRADGDAEYRTGGRGRAAEARLSRQRGEDKPEMTSTLLLP